MTIQKIYVTSSACISSESYEWLTNTHDTSDLVVKPNGCSGYFVYINKKANNDSVMIVPDDFGNIMQYMLFNECTVLYLDNTYPITPYFGLYICE